MKRCTGVTRIFLAALLMPGLALAQSAKSKTPVAPAPIAIKGGKLLTITHGVIENGVVVIENGKIAAVGPASSTAIPKNARMIDATGMTVYPGLIDSETRLGLTEISADQMTNDLVETSDQIMPHMHVYDAFHAESALIPVTRTNGITNAIVAPSSRDTLPGQDSFVQLAGRSADEMLLVRDIALPLNFTGEQRRKMDWSGSSPRGGSYPTTRMGMAAQLRQAFLDAQEYQRKLTEFEKKKAEYDAKKNNPDDQDKKDGPPTPPKRDLKLEALLPYLDGKKPVVLAAVEPGDLQVATKLAREFNLKIVLSQVTGSQAILDEIAAMKVPVIVGPIWELPKDNQRYDAVYKLPAELHKRGVKLIFASYDAHNARNLPYAAGYAVAWGLPYEEALKALTINPAEVWGVADQLGSLDVGKTANVVIANGDPLDVTTDVKYVFIAGREVPMTNRQMQLRDEYTTAR
ncbi:MAG: amidohydrolase family protein [Terriglobales bacterium]